MLPDSVTAATLSEIRAVNWQLHLNGVPALRQSDNAARVVPRLLAAVEAALKLADEAREIDSDVIRTPCWDLDPDELREAITAALTGTQPSENENHG